MLKKCNLFSRFAVMLLGVMILLAATPLTATLEKPVRASENCILGEETTQAERKAEFVMKDWWDIVKPDTTGMKITVVKAESSGNVDEKDMIVTALGMEETMEVLEEEPVEDELDELTASEVAGRTLTREESITLSAKELDCLQRIVQAEAGNEDIMGKILVANVVLNRYRSEQFPDTIEEVVTQTHYGTYGLVYQFTPAKPGGRFWTAIPSEETIEAVERALNGEDYSEGALYFAARKKANASHMSWFDRQLTWLFQHGNHEFYIG